MAEMSDVTPVLACRIESSVADHIKTNGSPSNVAVGYFGKTSLMMIHFHYGNIQVFWIADLESKTIWEAIEKWLQEGRIPIAFYVGDGKHVSNAVCVELSADSLPMRLAWTKQEPGEWNAAGQFFISDKPLAS
ncbi:hypothetical protein [Caballeronia sp. RCC_10]|uniref:hypothetical protein n=1 Tax=Caballeronia sp. RCC_10 TaxID=3239227 RepID=UPI003524BA6A